MWIRFCFLSCSTTNPYLHFTTYIWFCNPSNMPRDINIYIYICNMLAMPTYTVLNKCINSWWKRLPVRRCCEGVIVRMRWPRSSGAVLVTSYPNDGYIICQAYRSVKNDTNSFWAGEKNSRHKIEDVIGFPGGSK